MAQGPNSASVALADCLKLAKAGRHKEAESLCQLAVDQFPESVELRIFLSRILLARRDYEGAYLVLYPSISARGTRGDLFFNYGLALRGLGRVEEAIHWVQRAVDLDPKVGILRAKLGQLQLMVFRSEEAAANLELALEFNPSDVASMINLAHARMDLGDQASVNDLLTRASESGKEPALVAQQRGNLAETLGDYDSAVEQYTSAITLDPNFVRARVGLAYTRKVTDPDDPNLLALEELAQKGTIEDLDRGLTHYAIAKSREDLKQYSKAMVHYDAANAVFLDFQARIGKRFEEAEYRERSQKLADYAAQVPESTYLKARSDSRKPVFIVGMIRSGTTLVEQMLGRHPQIAPGGELRFWTQVGAKILQGKADGPGFLKKAVADYLTQLDRISATAPRVVDKMPTNYHLLGLLLRLFPEATFIHCKRDAVDTAVSIYTTKYKGSPDFGHHRGHIVSGYLTYLDLMKRYQAEASEPSFSGARIVQVKYESLVANPREPLQAILDAIGVGWDPACLEPEKSDQVVSTPSAWQVRQPIYTSSVRRADRFPAWAEDFEPLSGL